MGWLAKLFNAVPKEEANGLELDTNHPFWEVSEAEDFPSLFKALINLLPEGSVLYFEGGSPSGELESFFGQNSIGEQAHIAIGTMWPRPDIFHVLATKENLLALTDISERCAEPELAIHFHVYQGNKILLEWHDAFSQPMLLSGDIPEKKVKQFCDDLSVKYQKWENSTEQTH